MIRRAEALVRGLSRLLDQVSWFLLTVTAALTVFNVVARGFFNRPMSAIYDYVGFLTTMVIAFSLAECALGDGHVSLSLVVDMFPPTVKRLVRFVGGILGFVFLLVTGWKVLGRAGEAYVNGELTMAARLPYYPFVAATGLGLVVLSLAVLNKAFRALQSDAANPQ